VRARLVLLALVLSLLIPAVSHAQNATFEIYERTINRLVGRLGNLSESGVYQPMLASELPGITICHYMGYMECPGLPFGDFGFSDGIPMVFCETKGGGIEILPAGDPVGWQWWITDAHFTLNEGLMTFTATVRSRIGDNENEETRTVNASVGFDSTSNRLKIHVNDFTVPLHYDASRIATEIDVARLYAISIPIQPQTFTIPIQGPGNPVTAEVLSIIPHYLSGKIIIGIDVGF
jgi:hypothetical protein